MPTVSNLKSSVGLVGHHNTKRNLQITAIVAILTMSMILSSIQAFAYSSTALMHRVTGHFAPTTISRARIATARHPA